MENFQIKSVLKLNGEITTLLLLNNKKEIAICTANGFLYIYNIKFLKPKLIIHLIKETNVNLTILDIIEFKINNFCLACWDSTIKYIELYDNNQIYKIKQILKFQDNTFVNALKKLSYFKDKIIISSSCNQEKIYLWEYQIKNDKFNNYKIISLYSIENTIIYHQLESLEESIKYKELICGSFHFQKIFFYNLSTGQIQNLTVSINRCIRALKIIENDEFLLTAGNKAIYIIKLENKLILISIKYEVDIEFNCIFQKKNGNLLISEYGDVIKIKEFQFDLKKLSLNVINAKEDIFNGYITTMIELENGELIIGGYDKTVKVLEKSLK